jgi:hypothetical protein
VLYVLVKTLPWLAYQSWGHGIFRRSSNQNTGKRISESHSARAGARMGATRFSARSCRTSRSIDATHKLAKSETSANL